MSQMFHYEILLPSEQYIRCTPLTDGDFYTKKR